MNTYFKNSSNLKRPSFQIFTNAISFRIKQKYECIPTWFVGRHSVMCVREINFFQRGWLAGWCLFRKSNILFLFIYLIVGKMWQIVPTGTSKVEKWKLVHDIPHKWIVLFERSDWFTRRWLASTINLRAADACHK